MATALVQIATGYSFASTTVTANFHTPVTPGNCIVAIGDDFDAVFGTAAPTISDASNSYASVVSVEWALASGSLTKGIYAVVALNVLSVSSVTATWVGTGAGTSGRQLFIAEYSGVLTVGAIDGTASAGDIYPATSTVLSISTVSGPINATMRFTDADSAGGFGGILFGLQTGPSTDIIIASNWAVKGGTDVRSSVSGLTRQATINPPIGAGIQRFAFYFDSFGGNKVFGGPSRQGPPG